MTVAYAFLLSPEMHAIHNFENKSHQTLKNNIWELRMLHFLTNEITFPL